MSVGMIKCTRNILEACKKMENQAKECSTRVGLEKIRCTGSEMMRYDGCYDGEASEGEYSTVGGEILALKKKSVEETKDKASFDARLLIYSGRMLFRTMKENLEGAAKKIEELTINEGMGYVECRSSKTFYDSVTTELKLRVATNQFHFVVDSIRCIIGSDAQDISIYSKDIMDNYLEASSRSDTLSHSTRALNLLLKKATDVTEVMSVQRESTKLEQAHESQQRRARNLSFCL